uniref:FAD dependent oxidoreductase domain-containing protein n=1 Tax=viral metagenome TaxID=1070528 RepID=A0A6C0F5U7_9ZZZZ|tara:strand:+ start:17322 stop:18596 length:1275 start_codon:yes stop_codon:yes gene_type:complete
MRYKVGIAIGGSIGGLTAAIRLREMYEIVYCISGFDEYKEASNNGKTRGLRTVNLEEELEEMVLEGWKYWRDIGVRGDIISGEITHKFHEEVEYMFSKNHKELLRILDDMSPCKTFRSSAQIDEYTVVEGTGIYKIKEIVKNLKKIAKNCGVIMVKGHVNGIMVNKKSANVEYYDESMIERSIICDRCIMCIGNSSKYVETNMRYKKPISVWNEFSYYKLLKRRNNQKGYWTWGSVDYNTGEIYKNRLGFYVMLEEEDVLKVASDTSFIKKGIEWGNMVDYRKQKDEFVRKEMKLEYSDIKYDECYYAIAPFVQTEGNVSVIHGGGYGYCVAGMVLRAISGGYIPENKHYEMQKREIERHDLALYDITSIHKPIPKDECKFGSNCTRCNLHKYDINYQDHCDCSCQKDHNIEHIEQEQMIQSKL